MNDDMRIGPPKAAVYTLGCKVNQYESQAIAEALAESGFEISDFIECCDVYIINTCTVTAESDRKARQIIRRAWHRNPDAGIFVTGCYAQSQPEEILKLPGVVYVCGSRNKLSAAAEALNFVESRERGSKEDAHVRISDVKQDPFERMSIKKAERVRAGIKIEDGCDNQCTYCAISGARGSVVSKPPEDVLREAEALARQGYREIVLTGIETASYGKDLKGYGLIELLEAVDRIPMVERIRLGSLEPSFLREDVILRMAELEHLAPHFHLSVQSGSDEILRRMKRRYRAETVTKMASQIRRNMPRAMFYADIIAGFPGETEEQFQQTASLIEQIGFLHVHVFPYSRRRGTAAAEMPGQITENEKHRRVSVLNKIQKKAAKSILASEAAASRIYPVLFECFREGVNIGHTPNFLEIAVIEKANLTGCIRDVRVARYRDGRLYGILI